MQQAITDLEPLLTSKEVMKYLRISRSTLIRLRESGQLPARKVGARWRYYERELKQVVRDVKPAGQGEES